MLGEVGGEPLGIPARCVVDQVQLVAVHHPEDRIPGCVEAHPGGVGHAPRATGVCQQRVPVRCKKRREGAMADFDTLWPARGA